MIKACIFDCDGTLLDTLESISYCGNRALKDFGFREFGRDDYRYFVGDGAANLVRRALIKAGDATCSRFEEVFQRYKEYFAVDCMYEVKPYRGIVQTLRRLRDAGTACAVLSNKPHIQTCQIIRDMFEDGLFAYVQGQEDGLPIKPSPDGALKIAGALGVDAEECLYIGDTGTDMQTGNRAGMNTVGVLWGFRDRKELEQNHAGVIIREPEEITDLLKNNL